MINESEQPFVARGRSLLDQLLGMAQTRLEILSTELQQEKLALTRQLRLAVAAGASAFLAGLTLIIWVALAFPQNVRMVLLGVIFAVLTITSIASFIVLRRRARRAPLFARIIEQLRIDRASLGPEP